MGTAVAAVAVAACVVGSGGDLNAEAGGAAHPALTPVALSRVSLSSAVGGGGRAASFWHSAQALNTEYLLSLDPDRLLIGFDLTAGLPVKNGTVGYGGWCGGGTSGCAWVGHYLSALAYTAAASPPDSNLERQLQAKADYIIDKLEAAQAAIAENHPDQSGWVGTGLWTDPPLKSPSGSCGLYSSHKLLAGLVDQHSVARRSSPKTLGVAAKVVTFLHSRLAPLIAERGWSWWSFIFLSPGNGGKGFDIGGIFEAVWNVYALTRDPAHRAMADFVYNFPFFDQLNVSGVDALGGEHANAHLPAAVGVARAAEIGANGTMERILHNFVDVLLANYTFATGGSSVNEYWLFGNQHGDAFTTSFGADGTSLDSNGFHTQEMCTNYNALKVFAHLFTWTASPRLADRMERLLVNGVLGVQKPGQPGVMSYLTPLGYGVTRAKLDWWGWGSPDNSFWCCYGTTVEQMGKLGDSIFFTAEASASSEGHGGSLGSAAPSPPLTIAQYIPATLTGWPVPGAAVTVAAGYRADATALTVNVSCNGGNSVQTTADIHLRIPSWAASVSVTAAASGTTTPPVGTWHVVRVECGSAETTVVRAVFGMAARLERINDVRPDYATTYAVMWGPLVLAGLTDRDHHISADPVAVREWLLPQSEAEREGDVSGGACDRRGAPCGGSQYDWRVGALAQGDDLGNITGLLTDARAKCDALGPGCKGFTYNGPRDLDAPTSILLKADTAGNHSGWDMDKNWSTWLKVEPQPPNVGTVLKFMAHGDDGKVITFLPLNRIVDQTYTVHFNVTRSHRSRPSTPPAVP